MAKTPPFHGGVTSSILVRAIGNWLNKVRALISTVPRCGNLAQLVERHLEAVCVGGSIPSVVIAIFTIRFKIIKGEKPPKFLFYRLLISQHKLAFFFD